MRRCRRTCTSSGSRFFPAPITLSFHVLWICLKQNKMDDVLVLVGGIIPDQDIAALKKAGVGAIFQPGTAMDDIVQFIRANARGAELNHCIIEENHRSIESNCPQSLPRFASPFDD